MPIIDIENVTKRFRAARGARALLGRGGIADAFLGRDPGEVIALENVSLKIEPGESFGVIGANGSGKSTLLKIIAGVTVPTEGSVNVYGRLASLLELGAGFHPMLTGRENVYINAGIHGMRHKQVDGVFDEILEFSGIGKFIDYPIVTYSSGMYVRLGFAVAAYTNPDVFLIDEVLSVGDESFQRKCRNRMGELRDQGKTMVFVSHDLSIVNNVCDRIILLKDGKLLERSSTSKTIDFYLKQVGAEHTLHAMGAGDVEAIANNGRLSVMYKEEEFSANEGFIIQIYGYGQWQHSKDFNWEIVERSPTSCVARGDLRRFDATLIWHIELSEEAIDWRVELECRERFDVELLEILLMFPKEYNEWTYDSESGGFPELLPEDTRWQQAVDPDLLCERAAILPPPDSPLPTVGIETREHRPEIRGSWASTEYMRASRVLKLEEAMSAGSGGLDPGTHRLAAVRLRPGVDADTLRSEVRKRVKARSVEHGPLVAEMDHGALRLFHDGIAISTKWHVFCSLQIGHLWNDSLGYRWVSSERDGDALVVVGESRRFPFSQRWTIGPHTDGIGLRVELDLHDAIEVQEYHVSMMISRGYTAWRTDHEEGPFPEIGDDAEDWRHLNKDYDVGHTLGASGEGLPSVSMTCEDSARRLRMTALNTSFHEKARVLQALGAPDTPAERWEPGQYVLFDGVIRAS